jgi:hypothetical protein
MDTEELHLATPSHRAPFLAQAASTQDSLSFDTASERQTSVTPSEGLPSFCDAHAQTEPVLPEEDAATRGLRAQWEQEKQALEAQLHGLHAQMTQLMAQHKTALAAALVQAEEARRRPAQVDNEAQCEPLSDPLPLAGPRPQEEAPRRATLHEVAVQVALPLPSSRARTLGVQVEPPSEPSPPARPACVATATQTEPPVQEVEAAPPLAADGDANSLTPPRAARQVEALLPQHTAVTVTVGTDAPLRDCHGAESQTPEEWNALRQMADLGVAVAEATARADAAGLAQQEMEEALASADEEHRSALEALHDEMNQLQQQKGVLHSELRRSQASLAQAAKRDQELRHQLAQLQALLVREREARDALGWQLQQEQEQAARDTAHWQLQYQHEIASRKAIEVKAWQQAQQAAMRIAKL